MRLLVISLRLFSSRTELVWQHRIHELGQFAADANRVRAGRHAESCLSRTPLGTAVGRTPPPPDAAGGSRSRCRTCARPAGQVWLRYLFLIHSHALHIYTHTQGMHTHTQGTHTPTHTFSLFFFFFEKQPLVRADRAADGRPAPGLHVPRH